jgi:hypothetical protein
MLHLIEHDDDYTDVMMEDDLKEVILDQLHWKQTASKENLLRPLSLAIAYVEGGEATFSSVHACFLAVAHHVQTIPGDIPRKNCRGTGR